MPAATIGGRQLAFDDTGGTQPRTLVLLHAFPLDRRMWARSAQRLVPLARVITPDLRGFGGSALGETSPTIADFADDVAALLDVLGVARAVVGGLSMGGYVTLAFAARHASRTGGVVLADTRPGADSDDARRARGDAIAVVRSEGVAAYMDKQLPRLLAPSADADLRARVRAWGADQPAATVVAGLVALRDRPDRTPELARITCPALVIVGGEDGITPPSEAAAMAEALPDARLVQLAGAGHMANLEKPDAFDDAVAAFLRTLPSA